MGRIRFFFRAQRLVHVVNPYSARGTMWPIDIKFGNGSLQPAGVSSQVNTKPRLGPRLVQDKSGS
jgi:hypothetical protein